MTELRGEQVTIEIRCYDKVGFRPVGVTRASLWADVRRSEWTSC